MNDVERMIREGRGFPQPAAAEPKPMVNIKGPDGSTQTVTVDVATFVAMNEVVSILQRIEALLTPVEE